MKISLRQADKLMTEKREALIDKMHEEGAEPLEILDAINKLWDDIRKTIDTNL